VIVLAFMQLLGAPGDLAERLLFAGLLSVGISLVAVSGVAFARWLSSWRNFRRALLSLAGLITLIALAYTIENWRGKRAWEQHKSRWEAAGESFAIAHLAPPPVPDEKNFALTPLLKPVLDFTHGPEGAVWLDTNSLARLRNLSAQTPGGGDGTSRLALGSLEKGTLADLEACRDFYRGNPNYPQPAVSGTAAEDILVALGKFDEEMKELREAAATRPYARFPIRYDEEPSWGILLPHLSHLIEICALSQLRAIAKLELGQPAEAALELGVGFRLSDALRDEPFLISHLVRLVTLSINLKTVREGLVRHAWTDEQLAGLETYLAAVDLLAEYKLAIRGERAFATRSLDYMRRNKFKRCAGDLFSDSLPGFQPVSLAPNGWFYQNMLAISQMYQQFTLAAIDPQSRRVFPERSERLDARLESMPLRPYTLFARLLMSALGKATVKSARMQTHLDAVRLACALERYRLAHGELPGQLDDLAPHFIQRIPNDVMDGKPLRYRLNPDGSYILYSVGWNQTDEGGAMAWSGRKEPAVEITKGDWVWQMPSTN
jgi:hypothetical protein